MNDLADGGRGGGEGGRRQVIKKTEFDNCCGIVCRGEYLALF